MFTKLKQKLAEEEHSDLGSSLPSSPSSSRKYPGASRENKWHRRRLSSVSTYYGSRESLFTEPGIISRDPSFTAKAGNRIVNGSDKFSARPNRSTPKKDLLSILREKTQKIGQLENKLSAYEEEIEKWRELYEEQSLKKQELSKAVETKNQLSHCQINAKQKAIDILEKSSQLDELDEAYTEQKNQLLSMSEKLEELAQQRSRFEVEEQKLKQQASNLETENKTLKGQLNEIITELTQKSVELSKVEKCLELREKELNEFQETHKSFKTKTSSEISEKEDKIKSLEARLASKESSNGDDAKSEDDWLGDGLKEGRDRSSEINALATLVGSLNEKLERKDKELTSCKRVAEETIEQLKQKIKGLEDELEKAHHPEEDPNSSNDQLDALRQRNSYLEKELENVRAELTSAKRSKDNRPSWRRTGDGKPEERSRFTEKEFRQKEARYESQLADLQEERDQLQSELLVKDEECGQVSLCLEDALKHTSDLKKQIRKLEEALEEKTSIPALQVQPAAEGSSTTANVEIMEALRQEWEESREHNRHLNDILHERDDTIQSLRDDLKQKEEEFLRCNTKLLQFEDNNRLADRKRMAELSASSNEDYSYKDSYKQTVALKTRLKEAQAQLRLREDVESIGLQENESLRKQINEKDMKIKALQQKLLDLKKAFQRELKSSSIDCVEVNGTTENNKNIVGLLVSSSTQTDNEDLEYLDMNFKYLKHVVIKYMCSSNEKSRQMLPILVHLLRLTPKETGLIEDTFEWKLPLDY